jgi:hypothetical protein
MKSILKALGVLIGTICLALSAQAQCCYMAPPQAPDMRYGGYYAPNCYGQVYGPNFNVYPPFAPFQGMIPAPKPPAGYGAGGPGYGGGGNGGYGGAGFPVHPFARSPRDYFMIDFDGRSNPYRIGSTSAGSGFSAYSFSFGVGAIGDFAPFPAIGGPGVQSPFPGLRGGPPVGPPPVAPPGPPPVPAPPPVGAPPAM